MPWLSISCATSEYTTVGVIFAVVPVHLITECNTVEPLVFDRLLHVAGFTPELTSSEEIDAPVMVSVRLGVVASCTVPLQLAVVFDVVVTGVPAPSPATQVKSSGIEAIAAFAVALLVVSAFAPECSLWSHGFESPGLILTLPVMEQLTLLPLPAVIVVAPFALGD